MKLTDVLALRLKEDEVKQAFGLQGGAVVHIFDSFENMGIDVTYTHHEQAAGLAAVANAKVTGKLGCAVVTTGPGATNAITGLLAAWQDSIPCLFISGQARSEHTSYGRKVRQVGTQEVNICDIVKPITKYAAFVNDKDEFENQLELAISIAKEGRPGPVWLDIALDLQWADISPNLKNEVSKNSNQKNIPFLLFQQSLEKLKQSNRILFVFGYGVRLSGSCDLVKELINKTNLPFVTSWTATDLFATNHPLNLGIIGMSGQRGANKAVFDAEILVCVGSHLPIPQTTTLFDSYAPNAYKIIVNIDQDQLDNLNVNFNLKIKADIKDYLTWLAESLDGNFRWSDTESYKRLNWYEPAKTEKPNSNVVVRQLTKRITTPFCFVVDGGGTALYAGFQSAVLKEGDRIICSSAISAMGTGLAEVTGVGVTRLYDRMLCVIGDGSFLMNVQDLQNIAQYKINVIILVINNNGYLAIRHTQKEFLGGRFYGTHPDWNLPMPSIEGIAKAFSINYYKLDKENDTDTTIELLLQTDGPLICEVVVDEAQPVLFKQAYQANSNGTFSPLSLKEMFPFN